ncbi:hypothetical protein jhhlp_006323 [Lomentospora prolificans]|uniref:Beta-xylanase n=1 Tax=Lomentospora prolificans TaxID=41688 RepID=A0A2N3N5K8_9PEZI|nr:hypothetical protein jhhlp_006323 [Lomentospora prolificans]
MRQIFTILTVILAAASPVSAQLNELAKAAGLLYFGTAVDNPGLNNQRYMSIARDIKEFGQVTPANGQKWDSTERSQGQFSYGNGDAVTSVARQAGQLLRCHTLVWHSQLPSWGEWILKNSERPRQSTNTSVVNNGFSRSQMESVIRTHIQNVAGHYKGQCYAWDVVNEALEENGQYRQSPMYRAMGADFIPFAFKVAAEVDPGAKLYYNDYNIEHPGAKATAALDIVRNIKAQGARIDGVGGQGHWIVGQTPSKQDLMSVLASYAALVDEVAYTEIDIRHSSVPASQSAREQQARDYVTVVDACLQTPKCIGITIWDFADQDSDEQRADISLQYSWVPSTFNGQGEACLWDNNLNKKPAYTSLINHFQSVASQRGPATTSTSTISSSTSTSTTSVVSPTTVVQTSTVTVTQVSTATVTSTATSVPEPETVVTTSVVTLISTVSECDSQAATTKPSDSPPELTSELSQEPTTAEAAQSSAPETIVVTEEITETVTATSVSTVRSTITSFTSPPAPTAPPVSKYGQCGGASWTGYTVCESGATCSQLNDYYHQCI